ncbi:hypothetical protein EYF80_022503 [Liparis tanakae]|uniref:Uncharacterized protein n=1 Tax=Liparis tanakae TaxID=230148 RepID=A0A4Z2HQJ7_9TELE|nr:hypothetical protein EYF80_022503 [Liparis tanakae]
MEYETDSDCVSVTESQFYRGDLYKLEDILMALLCTDHKGRVSSKAGHTFPEANKQLFSVLDGGLIF